MKSYHGCCRRPSWPAQIHLCRGPHTSHCKTYYVSDAAWPAQIHLCRGPHTSHCKTYYVGDAAWPAQIHLGLGPHTTHCKTYCLERFGPAETRDFIILKGSRLTPCGKPLQNFSPALAPKSPREGKGKNSKLVISLSESGGLVPQVGILGVVL